MDQKQEGKKNMLQTINADIFTTGAKFIAHQTNCLSTNASGIAKEIFKRYPYSDAYTNRKVYSEPGTIQICGDGLIQRGIINMFAQYYPGGQRNDEMDSEQLRKQWFHQCLVEIAKIPDLHSIAFPFFIGCGLAEGDWDWYSRQLDKFSTNVHYKSKVFIYKLTV
jgi:O-acetyl-ADP-ribose deacetylase (regulator of RNase III)